MTPSRPLAQRLLVVALGVLTVMALSSGPARAADTRPIATGSISTTLSGNLMASALIISKDGTQAQILASGPKGDTLTVIDLATGAISRSVTLPADPVIAPMALLLATDGRAIVGGGSRITAIDTATGRITATSARGGQLSQPAIGPLGRRTFVVDQERGKLLILDAKTLQTVKQTPICPTDFASVGPGAEDDGPTNTQVSITPDGQHLFVACLQNGLQVVDPKSGKRTSALPKVQGEGQLAFSSDGTQAYLASGTTVTRFDVSRRGPTRQADVYQSGDGRKDSIDPQSAPVLSADGRTLFIPWRSTGVVKAVDISTLKATSVRVGGKAQWGAVAATLSTDGRRLFVITDSRLVTIDPTSLTVLGIDQAVPSGAKAEAIAVSGQRVVVAWTKESDDGPQQAGINVLTMPST